MYMLETYIAWEFYEAKGNAAPDIIYLFNLFLLVAFIVVSVFRCNALNWSGWRVIALFIPIAGFFLILFLLFKSPAVGNEVSNEIAGN